MDKDTSLKMRWLSLFVTASLGMLLLFWWFMKGSTLMSLVSGQLFYIDYRFAAGLEKGSPVRLAGVKVGQVQSLAFLPTPAHAVALPSAASSVPSGDGTAPTVRVAIRIQKQAGALLHTDAHFYINLAGIIGERYLEITPGTGSEPTLKPGSVLRGVDPFRLDQLFSQGYGVFGTLQDFLDRNEKNLNQLLLSLTRVLNAFDNLLHDSQNQKVAHLINNLLTISEHTKKITGGLTGAESAQTIDKLRLLIERASNLNGPLLRKFLQEEGVRAHIF